MEKRKWLMSKMPQLNQRLLEHYDIEEFLLSENSSGIFVFLENTECAKGFIPLSFNAKLGSALIIENQDKFIEKTKVSDYFYDKIKEKFLKTAKPVMKEVFVFEDNIAVTIWDKQFIVIETTFETEEEAFDFQINHNCLTELYQDDMFTRIKYWKARS